MRAPVYLAIVLVLVPSVAQAQNSVSDGVQALVGGDYQTAARILRPLAEETSQPDPLAQFFMAMLYASGLGVDGSQTKACGLYLAAARPENPLANQSLMVARSLQDQWGRLGAQLCSSVAQGDRALATVTFELGPGHRVTIGETGATVTYDGVEHRTIMHNGGSGVVFLPVQHTILTVSSPFSGQRHFLQIFFWYPSPLEPGTWNLGWSLMEVVKADLFPVTGDPKVTTLTEARPPASFDAESVVRLKVGEQGEAEWTIFDAGSPRRGAIPVKAAAR